ncbi:D-2-hydroxyacid dehydrogenase [Pseudoruegeria sp. HB172150]|uniref:D-2-hydroxyacid dehydrogenase n=1 Tax=Pseudoruegeria sp. HB172150 TaxID=2721164 RepID=UPI001552CED7|nr:D-2-hydroxyacid dehydrogenase [Pseudoruegeria sp. HB172150]
MSDIGKVLVLEQRAEWFAEALAEQCPGYRFLPATTVDAAMALAGEAEILVGFAPAIPARLVAAMPRLAWLQAVTTGVDNLLTMPELAPEVALTNCGGIHGPQMSEMAILMMMALPRRFPEMLENQKARHWERWGQPILEGKTVCILGLGAIAEVLAARCNAFGMRVTGVSDGRSEAPGVSKVYRRAALEEAAAEADFLVVLVPYTPETHHIAGERVFRAMKRSAYVINIARGACLDEAALIAALEAGEIAGAGLDVFAREPLPADDPIWAAPNTIVTPHIAGFSDIYLEQTMPVLVKNFAVYAAGGTAALPLIPHGG